MELLDVPLDRNGGIKEDWEDSLCSAGIVDYLPCKEEVLIVIEQSIPLLNALSPLEEKDKSVDIWTYSSHQVIIFKTIHFLYLNSRSSNLLDQFGEDSRIWFNSAPLIKHFYI